MDSIANVGFPAVVGFGTLIVATAVVFASIIWLGTVILWRDNFTDRNAAFLILFALGLAGAVVGFSAGLSREGVIGDVVPAILALFGGLSVYLFGIDRTKGLIASLCVIAFTSSFFVQLIIGSTLRGSEESRNLRITACIASVNSEQWDRPSYDARSEILGCSDAIAQLITDISGIDELRAVRVSARSAEELMQTMSPEQLQQFERVFQILRDRGRDTPNPPAQGDQN